MKRQIVKLLNKLGVKKQLKETVLRTHTFLKYWKNKWFNKTVRAQNLDYRQIPILIISFNQLEYLKRLIDFLLSHDYKNIVVIDNNSSYGPLLDYFETIRKKVTLHQLQDNVGHMVFWKKKDLFERYATGYFAVTDADVVPIESCPADFILHFKKLLDENLNINKVGFSLKIDDIPDANSNKEYVLNWESQFWKSQNKNGTYNAFIDTTFALYRPRFSSTTEDFLKGIRTAEPYQARHGGWYIENDKLTEEQIYYFKTCNDSSSWRVDEQGKLLKTNYKK